MATNKVLIDVKERGSKKAAGSLGKLKGALKGVITPALALGAAYMGSKMLLDGMKESIKLAGEQELAEKKLETAMGNNAQGLKDYAAELQKTTTFGDEATIEAMALMGAFTQNEEELKALTVATMDYAAATGKDLKSSAELVGRSFGTSMNAMQRYGVEVVGAAGSTERLESLTGNLGKMFGGQAATAAGTMSGKIDQMNNAIGDAQEGIGSMMKPLIEWGAVMVKTAAEGVGAFLENVQKIDIGGTMKGLFSDLEGWIDFGVDILKMWWNGLPVIIGEAWEKAKKVFTAAFEFIYGSDGIFFIMIDKVKQLAGFLWEPLPIAFNIGIKKIQIFFAEMWVELQNIGIDGVNKLIPVANKVASLLGFDEIPLLARTNMQAATQVLNNELGDLQEDLAETGMGQLLTDIFTITEEDAEDSMGVMAQITERIKQEFADRAAFKEEQDQKEVDSNKKKNKAIVTDNKKSNEEIKSFDLATGASFASTMDGNISAMQEAGMVGKREAKAAGTAAAMISTIEGAQRAYAQFAAFPPLAIAAAAVATAAGLARVASIGALQEGYSGVVDRPTMFMAGESGAEQVNVTNLDVPGGGINSPNENITVNVSGNVMTQEFVEDDLREAIYNAMQRNVFPYNKLA